MPSRLGENLNRKARNLNDKRGFGVQIMPIVPNRCLSSQQQKAMKTLSLHWMENAAVLGLGTALLGASAMATVTDYQAAVKKEAGLISYYTLDQSDARDDFGSNNGTFEGTAAAGPGVGNAGHSVTLDGAARVNLGAVADFDFADTTGSVEAWVRANWKGTLTYNPALIADRDGGTLSWSLHMNSDRRAIGMWNGSGYQTMGIADAGTDWHHLAVVFDTGTMTIYWDGVLLNTIDHALGTASASTQIGSSSASVTAEGFVGQMDEVALYGDPLTEAAVQAHYNALFAGSPPVIVREPKGGTFLPGVSLTLAVAATGPNLAYQWYKDGAALGGATSATLVLGNLSAANAGAYHVTVKNPAGTQATTPVQVAVGSAIPETVARYQAAVAGEASLLSFYTFDRLQVKDQKGAYDGTLAGTAGWGSGVGGGPDQGLLLDGGGHAALGAVSDFDFTDLTGAIEGWVRADWTSVGYNPALFADRDGGSVTWSVHMGADKKSIGMWNGGNYAARAIPAAGTAWHHVAVVFDNGSMAMYWDGVALGTVDQLLGGNFATTQFGSSASAATAEGWIGVLDDLAIYNDALTAEAVQAHYQAFFGGAAPEITGQPVGGAFLPGTPLQLTVSASGPQLAYQWFKDGVAVQGATGATLAFASLAAGDAGAYYARVSNPGGSVNSATVSVAVGCALPAYQAAVLKEAGLISYYTFDTADASDAKGLNPGADVGETSYEPGVGQTTNQALVLNGLGHIALGSVPAFEFPDGVGSVEAWLKPGDWSQLTYSPCVLACRSGGPVDWSIHMVQAQNAIGDWDGLFFQTLALPNAAGWHHFVMAFGQSKVWIYWDGQPLGNFAHPINVGSGLPTQIGSVSPDATSESWVGSLDEVALYSTTLSAEAVLQHYQAILPVAVGVPPLSFSVSGNQLTLAWPADATGVTLESADALPAATWTTVSGVQGHTVIVPTSGSQKYFRLRR